VADDRVSARAGLSESRRRLLVQRLRGAGGRGPALTGPVRLPAAGPAPLTSAQERLWFLYQYDPPSAAYHVHKAIELDGFLDVVTLEAAIAHIVARHDTLRTVFGVVDGRPVQTVVPGRLPVVMIDLTGESAAFETLGLRRALTTALEWPFDLERGPLVRAVLFRRRGAKHILMIVMHHIVSDASSIGMLFHEVITCYRRLAHGRPVALPPLPYQYGDFAWHRARSTSRQRRDDREFWLKRLEGAPALDLPTDYPRPPRASGRGRTVSRCLPEPVTVAMRQFAQREGVTVFMALLATLKAAVARYTMATDIVIGAPITNRDTPGTERLIGFFADTLALRTDLRGDPTFRELVRRVRETCLDAYTHRDVSFAEIVAALRPDRDVSRSPLFEVMFALQPVAGTLPRTPGLTTTRFGVAGRGAKFPLTLMAEERPATIALTLEYSTDLYGEPTAWEMLRRFELLLGQAVADPDRPLSRLRLLTPEEREQVVVGWNETVTPYPDTQTLPTLLAAQAARTPDATAVLDNATALTYAQLEEGATRLAYHLRALGVGPEVVVGVCLERSVALVVGLVAILKAGGAYLPLDPAYPAERLRYMLEDAGATVVITQATLRGVLPPSEARVVEIDTEAAEIAARPTELLLGAASASNLAYVIYTSGSTGRPKGILIEHRNAVALITWAQTAYSLAELAGTLAAT
jgi:hypothetical protein